MSLGTILRHVLLFGVGGGKKIAAEMERLSLSQVSLDPVVIQTGEN